MAEMMEARSVSVAIRRDWREVYEFVRRPENFARWASGAAKSLRQEGADWVADGPDGRVVLRFAAPNDVGVLDHWVVPGLGAEVYMPLRAIANGGGGCELVLTLFRQPGMTDAVFARDAEWVARDLATLKGLLEGEAASGRGARP
jgi:hypothetical protein